MTERDRDQVLATLRQTQDAYNSYMKESVRPILQISQSEEDHLTDAEIAQRVPEFVIRREYARRAIAMLDANIRYHEALGTLIPGPQRDASIPVVTALLAAAFGYYLNGPVLSMLLAALG